MTEVERKMQLTRLVREENAVNRMKVRNREDILYGSPKGQFAKGELPLFYDGQLGEEGSYVPANQQAVGNSSFGLRALLAILLFGAVVYMDKTGTNFNGELAAQVIARQVIASDEGKLIDFVQNFPYTFDKKTEEKGQ